MSCCLSLLTLIIPSIGMLSGLSGSITISLFFIFLIINFRKNLSFSIHAVKLEAIFTIWCLFCCFYLPNFYVSIIIFFQVFILVFLGLMLNNIINSDTVKLQSIQKSFIIGISGALFFFFFEYYFQGLIYKSFRLISQKGSSNFYSLNYLDRGCALLSISSWILIGFLNQKKQYLAASLFYIVVFYILYLSDSLASLVGFVSSGLLFVLGKLISVKFFKLTSFTLLFGSLIIPIVAYNINPKEVSDHYQTLLSDSAKHRLFIWHYVSKKIFQKPIFGWGVGSSKKYSVQENEMIYYKNYYWSPFPLHPHNNVLQILFETGFIGFLFFLLLIYKYLKKIEYLVSLDLNFGSAAYVCFINYYIIGMISFSIWQTWWVASEVWVAIIMKCFIKNNEVLRTT